MVIGIDASRANENHKTGTEWYAYHLIEQFKELADPQDQFILYSKETLTGDLARLPSHMRSRVLRWPPRFLWTQLRLSLEMLVHPPDVLFVPAHTIPLIHPTRTVTTLHDIGFEKFRSLYSTEAIGYPFSFFKWLIGLGVKCFTFGRYSNNELDYHRWAARFAVKHALHLITVSEFSKAEIQEVFGRKEEITVIPNGFDRERYAARADSAESASVLKRYDLERPYVISIGRKEIKKNTLGLIKAYDHFRHIVGKEYAPDLVLIGKEGAGYGEVQKTIRERKLEEVVRELGWTEEKDIPILFQHARFFVFPSFYEGFGIPLLEAMASGLPILASNVSAIPEVVGEAGLFCDPNHPEEIAEHMVELWTNKHLRQQLINAGRLRIEQFSWKRCAERTLALLRLLE